MGQLIVIVAVIVAAVLMFVFSRNTSAHKPNPAHQLKAYKTREDAIADKHTLCGDGEFEQEIVGEASYQKQINLIAASLPHGCNIVQATLEYENSNPHDNQAIAVKIAGLTVGYLPRDTARDYRKFAGKNGIPEKATCPAMIFGGGAGQHYGIWLGIPEIASH